MATEAQLAIGDQQYTLPIVESTEGNNGVDVSSLLKDTGATTFERPTGAVAAAAVVITIPVVIFVLMFQRRIVAGLTSGAVKG